MCKAPSPGPPDTGTFHAVDTRIRTPGDGATLLRMTSIEPLIRRAGGAIATHELHAAGITRTSIVKLLDAGRMHRVRQGWYALPDIAPVVRRAVRVGGVLTCATALSAHGFWSVSDRGTHVRVPRNACRLRSAEDSRRRLSDRPTMVTVHWRDGFPERRRLVASPEDALDDWFRCAPRDWALGGLDSVIRTRPVDRERLLERYGVSEWEGVDGRCESGTENVFYRRMLRLGIHPWRQVRIPGSSPFDFLIGSRLLVEVDGATFHDEAGQFARDRAKDALAHALGYLPLRFSHDQVIHGWTHVEAAVLSVVGRGDHLR